MNMSLKELLKRERAAWAIKDNWQSLYDDAYWLARPQQDSSQTTKGGDKKTTVYDSTLQKSTVKLAGMLQSTITPPFTKWAKIITGPFIQEGKIEVQKRLEVISEAIFAAISTSSFDSAMGEFYLDYIIGTAALLVLEGDDKVPIKFVSVPIAELALEEGPDSKIGGVYRRFEKPARTIKAMWPDMKESSWLNELSSKDGGKKVAISEITYMDYEDDVWRYSVILTKASDNSSDGEEIVSRTYDTNPWIIGRWLKCSGETYGRGPVLDALPDAKTCNMAKKLELQNASLAVSGVWIAKNNGVINPNAIKIQPRAVIPVMSTGGPQGADLARLPVGTDSIRYSQIIQKDLQQNIKDAMFDRTIPDQGAVRSATEWMVRQQELQEAIGAPFGRMFQEVIRPLFNRMLSILYKKGIIEEVKVDGGTFDVQITGSLAQAQAMKELEAITNWGQMAIALTGPEVFQATCKVENVVSVMADLMGIPTILIRSDEEKAQLVQIAQQAIAQQ